MKKVPIYFNSRLCLDYNKQYSRLTDRVRLLKLMPSILVGVLLFLLGLYEWLNMFQDSTGLIFPTTETPYPQPLIAVWFFDWCFMIIGLGLAISKIFTYFQYNKYIIKGADVTIIHRRLFKGRQVLSEKLANYSGVRFRMEFHQSGFILKTLYILELYHHNVDKIVPLYIATTDKKLRHIWKDYAKKLKLPALLNTDEGIKQYSAKELNKSVRELYKQGVFEDKYDDYSRIPSTVTYARKKDKIVLKIRKIIWDIFNFVGWFGIIVVALFALLAIKQLIASQANWGLPFALLMAWLIITFICLQFLFRKEKLVLKKHKIVHTYKYMLFSTKHNQIFKKDIEAIEVMENPATGRLFIGIISDDNAITFGAKLSKKDLNWIKKFLIHEIIK